MTTVVVYSPTRMSGLTLTSPRAISLSSGTDRDRSGCHTAPSNRESVAARR